MKIKSIEIDNFKSLLNFKLIEPNPFSVFVGANGVGKSNIFEALEYWSFKAAISFEEYDTNQNYSWHNVDELFGGTRNFLNYNNYNNPLKINVLDENLNNLSFKLNFKSYSKSEKRITSQSSQILPRLNFKNQFINNFSRIFTTSKDANKLNLSNSDKKLNFNCDNLENVLKRILDEPHKALEIKEWLDLLRPGFSDIKIEKDLSEKPVLQFYEIGYEKPFAKNLISDGTFNILCLLTAIYQTDEPQFLCIEEPENGLNPYAIKELVKFFRQQCADKGHYIWLNTHSQTIVNLLQPEEIIIVNKKDGITVAKQLKDKDMHGLPMDEAWLTNALGGGVPW